VVSHSANLVTGVMGHCRRFGGNDCIADDVGQDRSFSFGVCAVHARGDSLVSRSVTKLLVSALRLGRGLARSEGPLHPPRVQGQPWAAQRPRDRRQHGPSRRCDHRVADHRRHQAFADKEGDLHSPWLYGTTPVALARGFWHAHSGWLFGRDRTNADRFTPDLLADRDIARSSRQFPHWTVSLLTPALLGGDHADRTCARHGVKPGQLDMSARVIQGFEKLGWAHAVRRPTPTRIARITATEDAL
jgi:hypothetical protein